MKRFTHVIEVKGKSSPLRCGRCHSLLLGYDEIVCPVCGTFNDMDNPRFVNSEPKEFSFEQIDKMIKGG